MSSRNSSAPGSRVEPPSPDVNDGSGNSALHTPHPSPSVFATPVSRSSPVPSDASGSWSSQPSEHKDDLNSPDQATPNSVSTFKFTSTTQQHENIFEAARQRLLSQTSTAVKEYQRKDSVWEKAGVTGSGWSKNGSGISYTRKQRDMVFDRQSANGELGAMISVAEDLCGKGRVDAMLNQMGYSHTTLGSATRGFRHEGWEEEQNHESGSGESGILEKEAAL